MLFVSNSYILVNYSSQLIRQVLKQQRIHLHHSSNAFHRLYGAGAYASHVLFIL